MGIDLHLETETGEAVQIIGDDGSFLKAALDGRLNIGKVCLQFIDPFGNTVFNHNQWPYLEEELQYINQNSTEKELKEYTRKALKLIDQSQDKSHHYFRFVGD